jgi:transcription factor E2F7/8
LALLSLNLVQFFYEKGFLQTLEDTANQLTGGLGSKLKTKIRRLYDITNVFKAMGLVKKTITKDRKVAIEWLGKISIGPL